MPVYSSEFIQALALWQNGWRECSGKKEELASGLYKHKGTFPSLVNAFPGECYRVVLLDKRLIGALFSKGDLPEVLSSWTTDRTIAEKFKDYLPEGKIGFIFKHTPKPEDVFLNIPAMWQDPNFEKDLQEYKKEGVDIHPALEHFKFTNNQSEVILQINKLTFNELVGLSGKSSFEGLCKLAGVTSEEEQEELFKECVQAGHFPEDTVVWLSENAVWRVIDRVNDHLEKVLNGTREPLTAKCS